jgi:hypothetical protein
MKMGYRKPSFKKRVSARTSLKRAVRAKTRVPKGYGVITNPKKAMYNRVYNRTTKKACYVATAVYGDVDAWQVVKLREYRDKNLRKTFLGRMFINIYYLISPKLVKIFENIKPINNTTRKLLDKFIEYIK